MQRATMFPVGFILVALAIFFMVNTNAEASKKIDEKKKEETAEVQEALDAAKAKCGCLFDIKIGKYPTVAVMLRISDSLEAAAIAAKNYCSEEKYKKAFCEQVKKVSVKYHKEELKGPKFNKEAKTLELESNDFYSYSAEQIEVLFDRLVEEKDE